ncbi:MAG: hypothetical protein AWU54_409 [Candidatus Frackibacter sp. T328-2]|jgi:transcription initiation factor IIE alpha subunit|nr:MAG: hypothetical protein AWU54_409 [Candidatus Frackibacter sp. T328-2]
MKNLIKDYLEKKAVGRMNAVTSKTLKQLYGVKGSAVRRIVHELRVDGLAVCSDSTGYFIAENERELDKAVNNLRSRMNSIKEAMEGLERCEVI